jgi:hypothetical protein
VIQPHLLPLAKYSVRIGVQFRVEFVYGRLSDALVYDTGNLARSVGGIATYSQRQLPLTSGYVEGDDAFE